MAILNVEWCNFVVFSNDSVIVDCILADYDYWKKMCNTLDEFYMNHACYPEILSGTIFTLCIACNRYTHYTVHTFYSCT